MSQWQIVAHVNEVANPGDYVLLPGPYGRQIVVSNFDGLIKVWNNRCPHRGARIHTEPHGNGPAVCKYHGRCAKPGQPNFMDYPSVVGTTWVYASLDGTADHSPAYLTGFSLPPGCKLFHRLDMVLPCNVHVAIENALEAEHVAHVHTGSLGKLGLRSTGVELWADGASGESFVAADPKRLDALTPFFPPRLDRQKDWDYRHSFLTPYTALSSVRGFTYSLQHYFPREDGRCDFVHRMYVPPTSRGMSAFFKSAAALNDRIFQEDAEVCALVPDNHYGRPEPGERRIAHYRESKWNGSV